LCPRSPRLTSRSDSLALAAIAAGGMISSRPSS
jgi:hypothetical protein